MPRPLCCRFCRAALDPAQEFAYLVESQTVDNPTMLAAIRRLPHAHGRPVPACRGCQAGFARTGAVRPPVNGGTVVLAAVAAAGLVALTTTLGRWFGNGVT